MKFDAQLLTQVLIGIHMVALPLYPRMPLAVLLSVLLLTLWTVLIIRRRVALPGRYFVLLLAAAVVAVLLQSYGTIFGQQPGTAMVLLLCFLKLFEMKHRRDVVLVIFLGYFLIASNFFFTQAPWAALYVFFVVVYLTSLLVFISDRRATISLQSRLILSTRLILLSLPLMLILFVLFPRIPGPLWGLPKDAHISGTGISDEMSPGSVNRLIASGEVAFRVRFHGQPPPHRALYWRGVVLSDFDGRTWRRDDAPASAEPNTVAGSSADERLDYTVTLEPSKQKFLFALDLPVSAVNNYRLTRELMLLGSDRVIDVMIYSIQSDVDAINQGLFEPEQRKNLELPPDFNPRSLRLARQLWRRSNGVYAYIEQVLEYFRQQEFVYTLSPPLLGRDSVDEFIFDTRRGFCEHYAGAFVTLMRAAGVPARVVMGYQGGEMNPVDDYMIVRQSDAHAWAEVWLDGRGWLRVDPTAAVSPARIELGMRNAGLERELLPSILNPNSALMLRARYLWDSLHNSWNQWVVGFDLEKQRELFSNLGIGDVSIADLVLWLVLAMTLAGAIAAWWVFRYQPRTKTDRVRYYYDVFCNKFAKAGIERRSSEAAGEFLQRIRQSKPAVAGVAARIIDDYQQLRYGPAADVELMAQFSQAVRKFRVRKG